MNKTLSKLSWLNLVAVVFCYYLYGWGLRVNVAPPLYWIMALIIAAFLSLTITYSLLLSIPATLAASALIVTNLALDVSIIRGTEAFQAFANNFRDKFLFSILAFVISMLWFSPLFWSNQTMSTKGMGKNQIIAVLIGLSWLGLGLGWLMGQWY